MKTKHKGFTEPEVRFYLAEIILAVEKLHKVGTLSQRSPLQ
jgi:hypothetical protein